MTVSETDHARHPLHSRKSRRIRHARLTRRGLPPEAKRLIALDETRREKILALETAQARRNAASKEIGEAKKNKDEETGQSA